MTDKYQTREERRRQLQSANNKKTKEKTSKDKKQKDKKKGAKQIFKRIFLVLISLGIVGIIAGGITFAVMVKDAPKLDESVLKDSISSTIYDINDKPIEKIGAVNRDYVQYDDIPDLVKNAVIATEDSRFFEHHGIDPIRLGGAVIANFTDGFGSEGASTITQQVVKNFFFNQPQKTLSRKAQEAWLAIQLERKYTKQEIFEMYVNKIFMSENMSGIKTASKVYFDKELDELTLPEAAMLAGMPQAPNAYNPFNNPDRAEKRRNIVLSLMNQHGYISEAEMKEAQATPLEDSIVAEKDRETSDLKYDPYIKQVIAEIEEKYPDVNVFTDGLEIHTTLDTKAQDYVDKVMYEGNVVEFPDEDFQAGITLLDTKTGGILALGGDRDPDVKLGFNYATENPRQPGSTIKPILDYGPAIEYLKWGTYETIEDKPTTYNDADKTPINNFDNKFLGSMSIREALARSRNIPALEAFRAAGAENAQEFANNLGIPLKHAYESYSIGGIGGEDKGITTLQLAGAYSAFGNEGVYNTPHAVRYFKLNDGTKINMEPESEVAMQDYTAFMITDMLKSVVNSSYGTGSSANVPGLPIAGKTGTTNYSDDEMQKYNIPAGASPDAWFAGYTTNYTMAIWTGYENRKNYLRSNTVSNDQRIAQLLFKNIMQYISQDVETDDFKMPDSVEKVSIEKGTYPARLASSYTPSSQILTEYAVKGNIVQKISEKYNKLDPAKNAKASYDKDNDQVNVSWSYGGTDAVKFDVSVSINGGASEQLTTTSDKSVKIAKPDPGSTYTFTITAKSSSMTSDSVSASVKIPAKVEEQPAEDENETVDDGSATDDENTGSEEETDNSNNGNGNNGNNGNGNSSNNSNNGNGNSSNNGNNGNNGNGNGNKSDEEADEPDENENEPDENEADETTQSDESNTDQSEQSTTTP